MSVLTGAALPEAQPSLVRGEVAVLMRRRARARNGNMPSLLLLRAAPSWSGPDVLDIPAGEVYAATTARVRPASTVLAVLDAIADQDDDEILVVLTPCDETELGSSILARAAGERVRELDLWSVIQDESEATAIDRELTGGDYGWLAEAVLSVPGLLSRVRGRTKVLRRDDLLDRLAAHRLSLDPGQSIDPATLLDWSRDQARVATFMSLDPAEVDGIVERLTESVGPVARVVFGLARTAQSQDAVPLGLVAAELYSENTSAPADLVKDTRIRVEMRFLGGDVPDAKAMRVYAETCIALISRWTEGSRRREATVLYDRAAAILTELHAGAVAEHSGLLRAGFDARQAAFAQTVAAALPTANAAELAAVERALTRLAEHRVAKQDPSTVEPAVCAVRLLRWLNRPEPSIGSPAEGVAWQVHHGGWVDRALRVIRHPGGTGTGTPVFGALAAEVRTRRAKADREFATRLAAWHGHETEHLLLAENLLDRVARPLAREAAPLVIVVDGMSTADASLLAEQITEDGVWTEIGRDETGRDGVLSVLPSATRFSRTSLFNGALIAGGQREEDTGFAAFWKKHRRAARLFHKGDLRPEPGNQVADTVAEALDDQAAVVGVVLNTIDDALRSDERIGTPLWTLDAIEHVKALLEKAAKAGRPVVLTSDHGHIRDFGDTAKTCSSEGARYRSAQTPPSDGEMLFTGTRVLFGGGSVVMPYDETTRYANRKAGYHGGATLAEMVIPLLMFLPAGVKQPSGWARFEGQERVHHEPDWWQPATTAEEPASPPVKKPTRRKPKPAPAQDEALFTAAEVAEDTLGTKICATPLFAAQAKPIPHAPEATEVARIIDALDAANGRLPASRVAELAGKPAFRIGGYVATLIRILNVEGYRVLARGDEGRTVELNTQLLVEQFLGGKR